MNFILEKESDWFVWFFSRQIGVSSYLAASTTAFILDLKTGRTACNSQPAVPCGVDETGHFPANIFEQSSQLNRIDPEIPRRLDPVVALDE
jgi:hypothetical protein